MSAFSMVRIGMAYRLKSTTATQPITTIGEIGAIRGIVAGLILGRLVGIDTELVSCHKRMVGSAEA